MSKKFRDILFWLHLVAGLVGGLVIAIMCITGAALSFEKNIIEIIESDRRVVKQGAERQPISKIVEAAAAYKPSGKASAVLVKNEPDAAVTVSFGREAQVFVDPYTAVVTGEGSHTPRAFFGFMTDLHRWLVLSGDNRPLGKAITGACNLMFLFLAISGVYIWMPRRFSLKHLRPISWFRSTKSTKARDFNWHNTIGFWTSLVMVALTVTAAVISYKWASDLVYTVTGNEPPRQQQQSQRQPGTDDAKPSLPKDLDQIWSQAASHTEGWVSMSLKLPVTKDAVFTIDEGASLNIFGRSTLTINAAEATVSKWEPYDERNSGQKARSWMRFIHTGESFGLIGQLIGFIACIGGAVLVYTGISLAIRRCSRWFGRRRQSLP